MRGLGRIARAYNLPRCVTLAIAVVVGLMASMPFNVAAQTTRTYTSQRFHYHFDFPARYVLDPVDVGVTTPIDSHDDFGGLGGDIDIGTFTGPNASGAVVETWTAGADENDHYPDFLAMVSDKAKMLCGADGPEESIDCTKLARSRVFTTDSGLKGYEFYLVMRTKHIEPAAPLSTKVVGPFYAFDISAQSPNKRSLALIIDTPVFNDPHPDLEALATVARSFVIDP